MRTRLRWSLLPMLVAWCCCVAAHAQTTPIGAVAPAQSDRPSHSWAVIERNGSPMLVHVQPREGGPGFVAADPGSVRPVRPLVESPDAMAALGDRVYLFYAPTGTDANAGANEVSQRPVYSVRTVPSAIAGMWVDLPTGLMDALPPLPASGRLIGVAAGVETLFALERAAGRLWLWSLDTGAVSVGWTEVPVPVDIAGNEPLGVAIVSFADGAMLALRGAETTRAWSLKADGRWEPINLVGWDRFWGAGWRQGYGREVLALQAVDGQGTTELWRLGTGEPVRIATVSTGTRAAAVALPEPGRLVLIRQGEPAEQGRLADPIGVQELSLVTGRTLHEGPAAGKVAVPVNELRVITLIVVLMMAGALIAIIRPNPDRPWTVPDGWVLADPGRRMMASMLDLVLIVVVLAPAFGVSPRQVLTLEVLIHPSNAWLVLPSTIVTGWISMSVWEALLGLTPGKFVLGCRVRQALPGPAARVPLFWCLVRNAMKWLTPPVAAMALFDPEGRHRGDAAARAVVVARAPGAPGAG